MNQVKVRVGYACINLSLKAKFRTFRLKTVEDRDIVKIKEVIGHNIRLLGDIIQYNIKNNIYVYRISSEIIPFGSNSLMKEILRAEGILEEDKIVTELSYIKTKQEEYDLRLSMHPSHFTLFTSPNEDITERALSDIAYQTDFVKRIGGKNLILHIGGAYGDKEKAINRFIDNINKYKNIIDTNILTIENDDKTYTSKEVVEVCKMLGLKWVYDFHHERCNKSDIDHIEDLLKAYPPNKYHLSSGIDGIYKPPHADYIEAEDYRAFTKQLIQAGIREADVVLEAKKKNLAIYEILEPIGQGYWQLKE